MRKEISTLRTFPNGFDKPAHDIHNLSVIRTRLVRNVGDTGLHYWVGIGRLHPGMKAIDVCKPATNRHVDYWFNTSVIEKEVLGEHSAPARRDRRPI